MQQLFSNTSSGPAPSDRYDLLQFPDTGASRPYVILNFVTTLDGQATLGSGGAVAVGSATDHRLMRELRASADALLHGAGTVRANNFAPVVPEGLVPGRVARGLTPQPLPAVVTRSGDLDPHGKYFSRRPPVVFTTNGVAPVLSARLGPLATVVPSGADGVDVRAMLEILWARHGIHTLVCEGGPKLAYGLLAAECIDEIFLTLAPKIGSDLHAPRLVDGPAFLDSRVPMLDLVHVLVEGSELFLRYRIVR